MIPNILHPKCKAKNNNNAILYNMEFNKNDSRCPRLNNINLIYVYQENPKDFFQYYSKFVFE